MYPLNVIVLIPDTVPTDVAMRHFTEGLTGLACDLARPATEPQRLLHMPKVVIDRDTRSAHPLGFGPHQAQTSGGEQSAWTECERLARELQSAKRENLALRASLEQRAKTTEELAGQVAERVRRHPTKPKTNKKPAQGKGGRFVKAR